MESLQSQQRPDLSLAGLPEQNPDTAIDGQYNAMAAQAISEANEQLNQQEAGLNPFLMRMFLQSRGNQEMTKLFAGLLAADYVSKQVIQYAEYNPQVAEVAHLEEATRRQVAESMHSDTDSDENVVYAPFGQRSKRKKTVLAKVA